MKSLKLILALNMLLAVTASGQIIKSKLDVYGGIGAQEYVHIGLRYQYYEATQIAISYGGDMGMRSNETITTFSVDHWVHFGKNSYLTNRGVWYGRIGYTHVESLREADYSVKYGYIPLGIGREFAINNWLGVNADLGTNWLVREKEERNSTTKIKNPYRWMPMARIQVFVSF